MAFLFENLRVYQESLAFADTIIALTKTFPRGFYFLADQLNRAAASIPTNIAEGNGRFTKADRKHFFTIARGSLLECVPLLDLAYRHRMIDEPRRLALREHIETISKMLTGLIHGCDQRSV
ncbi:MAG: four helix bundle protein [Candidatus Aureabacteria bacterium]|nr:four helix bundle protein [Candidatus Auribacterota bacterium]